VQVEEGQRPSASLLSLAVDRIVESIALRVGQGLVANKEVEVFDATLRSEVGTSA